MTEIHHKFIQYSNLGHVDRSEQPCGRDSLTEICRMGSFGESVAIIQSGAGQEDDNDLKFSCRTES